MGRVLTIALRNIVLRLNQAVYISDDQTITGAKTFVDVVEVFDIFAGARFRHITRGSTTATINDSDTWITTNAALTISTSSTGWRALIQLGGDHDITFLSTTVDVSTLSWGTGDILFFKTDSPATSAQLYRIVAAADIQALT